MNEPNITDWLGAAASTLTFLAAFAALLIARGVPKAAARWAELYRRQSETETERERLRMQVFTALIRCRSQLLHADAIAALNLIDLAFSDEKSVREAYQSFIQSTEKMPYNFEQIVERYHTIIDKISGALGMSDTITIFDIQKGYYPTALGKLDEAALADAEEKIARRANRIEPTNT